MTLAAIELFFSFIVEITGAFKDRLNKKEKELAKFLDKELAKFLDKELAKFLDKELAKFLDVQKLKDKIYVRTV